MRNWLDRCGVCKPRFKRRVNSLLGEREVARQVGFKDVLASYEGAAIQLGSTLVLQAQNSSELQANARERQHDLRRWRSKKSRTAHTVFFEGDQRRRQQIVFEGMKLQALVGNR